MDAALAGHATDPSSRALADTATRYQIPREYLTAVIDGVEMDLAGAHYETFAELEQYCYRVASVVGLACIHIWGFRGPQALEPARRCGIAFQLTNILRDLREDIRRGRVYLPNEDLRRFGYTTDELDRCEANDRFTALMQFEIDRAQKLLRFRRRTGAAPGTRRPPRAPRHDRCLPPPAGKDPPPPDRCAPPTSATSHLGKSLDQHEFDVSIFARRQFASRNRSAIDVPPAPHCNRRRRFGGPGRSRRTWPIEDCKSNCWKSKRQLGGRATSFRDPASGELVDHCQHVSLGCCTNLEDFCRRTGLIDLLHRQRTLHFFAPDGRRYDLSASRWLPAPLHLLPSLLRLRYLTRSERFGVIRALRQLAARIDELNETIGNWLRQHGQTERAIELFWTPVIVSALSETIDRAAVPPVQKVFVDAFLGHRHAYEMQTPQVPLGEFYGTRLEQWLTDHGITVRRECGVKQLIGDANGVKEVLLADETQHSFDAVIVAVPWRRIATLLSGPLRAALPELRDLNRLESAPITAVHLWFDRPITDLPHAVLPGRISQWVFRHGPQLLPGRH